MKFIFVVLIFNSIFFFVYSNEDLVNGESQEAKEDFETIRSLAEIYLNYLDALKDDNLKMQTKLLMQSKRDLFKNKLNFFISKNPTNVIILNKIVDELIKNKNLNK